MPEPCMLVSQTAYHTEGQFGRSQLVQLGMCGEICDPVFSTKSCLFVSLQSWCGCLRTGGDQALDLQPYSGGLTLKTKHAAPILICIPPGFT